MSIYSAIVCEQCRTCHDFVSLSAGGQGWMAGAINTLPSFIERHVEHLGALRVVSEHDDRWGDYQDESNTALKKLRSVMEEVAQETTPRNSAQILKYFTYEHLPEPLQEVSKPLCELAYLMAMTLPESPEFAFGLRMLLLAKDAFVRARL